MVGYVKNPIRNYVFGFQNCVNKRALLWNEAVIDPYFYEDVKPILAGDSPNVQVKNCGDGTVRATPVFVLSNRDTSPTLTNLIVGFINIYGVHVHYLSITSVNQILE